MIITVCAWHKKNEGRGKILKIELFKFSNGLFYAVSHGMCKACREKFEGGK